MHAGEVAKINISNSFIILSPPRNAKKSLLYLTPIRHHQFLLQFCWSKMIQNSRKLKVKQAGFLKVFKFIENDDFSMTCQHISIYCLMRNQMPPLLPEQHAP